MAIDQHEDDPRAAESARPSSAPPRRAIEVVYRGGRLTPAEPLDLPDGTPVLLRVPGHAVSGRMSNGAWRSEPAPQPELGAVEGICEGGAIALASPLGLPEGTPLRLEIDERVAVMAALPIDRADIAQPRPDNGGAGAGPKQPADAAWAGLLGSRSGWRAFAAVMLALVLVYGGQLALSATSGADPREGSVQALAGGMLIAGALLFGAATRRWRDPPARLELPRDSDPPALARAERESPGWLAAAIALSAGAIGAFAVFGESPAVVLAWLASMAALLFSQLWNAPLARARVAREPRPYLAALALLLAIALITRAYNLTTLPYNVDGDFASVGLLTRALATGQQRQIFAYDGWAFQPWLGYLAPWLTMLLFGTGLAGLNASGVAAGLLIILGVYLLGRDLFQPRVGLLAAALLTISYAHLAASRQSSYIDPVLYLVYALYFLLVGLREDRGWALVASGALTSLCLQTYFSGRIVVFIVAILLLYLLLLRRPWLLRRRRAIVLWALAVAIALGPMLLVFILDVDGFLLRTRDVFILNPEIIRHERTVYQVDTLSGILLQQARRAALLFHYYADTGTQFRLGRPFLDPFTAPLFTLGLGYALFRWRRAGHALLLAWVALAVIVGSLLTANPPFWPRLMVLLPPTALLAALALDRLYELAKADQQHSGRWGDLLAPVALALLLAWAGAQNWSAYVAAKGSYATPRALIARYLAEQPPAPRAYLVSAEFKYRDREFEFLAPGRLAGDLAPEQAEADLARAGDPTLVILTPEQDGLLQRLRQRFPGASAETHSGNTPDEVAFYVLRLP